MQFDNFWNALKVENAVMATLAPLNEVDTKLHQELLSVMENRVYAEYDFLHEVLQRCLDNIKFYVQGN